MDNEVIVVKKSQLKEIIAEELNEFKGFIENLALKKDLPKWIKGDKKAGELLGVSDDTMRMRRFNGHYREGADFTKKGGIIMWNTDALLNPKRTKNGKD